MNYIQENFISKYIISQKKNRLLYEINSKKKKSNFINHFCHDTLSFVIPEKIVYSGNISNANNYIIESDFLVISSDFIDRKMMNKEDLILYMEKEYMAIVAISDLIAIIKEEYEFDSHIFILKNTK